MKRIEKKLWIEVYTKLIEVDYTSPRYCGELATEAVKKLREAECELNGSYYGELSLKVIADKFELDDELFKVYRKNDHSLVLQLIRGKSDRSYAFFEYYCSMGLDAAVDELDRKLNHLISFNELNLLNSKYIDNYLMLIDTF